MRAGSRRDRAGFLHARPQQPQCPDLGHRQELVLVDGQRKSRYAARHRPAPGAHPRTSADARRRTRARCRAPAPRSRRHCGRRGRRLRAGCRAGRARRNAPATAASTPAAPRSTCAAGRCRRSCRRVDAERYAELGRIGAPLAEQRHQPVDARAACRMHVEADVDAVERHVVQRDRQRFGLGGQAVAEGVRRALENQRKTGRALVDVLQRLPVGAVRIGIVDALRHDPRRQRIGRASRAVSHPVPVPPADRCGCRHRCATPAHPRTRRRPAPFRRAPAIARARIRRKLRPLQKVAGLHCSSHAAALIDRFANLKDTMAMRQPDGRVIELKFLPLIAAALRCGSARSGEPATPGHCGGTSPGR